MFASLVIQLPSSFKGGDIRVSHQGKTMTLDSSVGCNRLLKYSAFYSDCMHELLPVTEGWRMCLVYNVVCPTPEKVPEEAFRRENATLETLRRVCKEWRESGSPPSVLGYSLENPYKLQECGFGYLKGHDRVVGTVMRDATDEDGSPLFDVRLVVFDVSIATEYIRWDFPCTCIRVVVDPDGKEAPDTALKEEDEWMFEEEDGLFRRFEDLSCDDEDCDGLGDGDPDVVFASFLRYWSGCEVQKDICGVGDWARWYHSPVLVFKPFKFGNAEWEFKPFKFENAEWECAVTKSSLSERCPAKSSRTTWILPLEQSAWNQW